MPPDLALMSDTADAAADESPAPSGRGKLRPLVGIPGVKPAADWRGGIISFVLHALVILLLLLPAFVPEALDFVQQGAGGPGPAGGGGGGRRGTGGLFTPDRAERLRYVEPPRTQPVPTPAPVVPPPEQKKPEEKKPEPPTPVPPTPAPPAAAPVAQAETPGTGGGSGDDGSKGNGIGSGGGIGSGVGTGKGSGTGPGTGGGMLDKYPPTVTSMPILPIPVPDGVRPYRLRALFDVDEKGKATLIAFNPSNNDGYNKRVKSMLQEMRFRPAVRKDGMAIRDTFELRAEAP
jgi:protein TonB